jgi:hypothetical protein
MIKVESSAISELGYDVEQSVLYVEFKTGALYKYLGVPEAVYTSLMRASSIGSFFDREVRKKSYRYLIVREARS